MTMQAKWTRVAEGMILVAQPAMREEPLRKAVMLIVGNDGNSVYTGVNIASEEIAPGSRVYNGGPTALKDGPLRYIFAHESSQRDNRLPHIGDTGYVMGVMPPTEQTLAMIGRIRSARHRPQADMMLVGSAVWTAEYLGLQMNAGFWRVSEAKLDDLMRLAPEQRWEAAMPKPGTVTNISEARARVKPREPA